MAANKPKAAAPAAKPAAVAAPSPDFVVGPTGDIKEKYKLVKKIGQPGQFGYAMIAQHIESKQERAVKVISKSRFTRAIDKAFQMAQLRAEISVMKKMNHPNIITFYEVFENEAEIFIVMELCRGGELFDRIKAAGNYSEKDAATALRQMFQGVAYMHSQNVAHCDLKPDNFLFLTTAADSLIKIIDFGMSKFVKRGKYFKSLCGTPYYVAPEVIAGHYNQHSDLWSLGVVMFVMLFGYPPFYADEEKYGAAADSKIFEFVQNGFDPTVREGYGAHFPKDIPCSDSAKDLIARLLTLDIAKRITAEEALRHPWLKGDTASSTPISPEVLKDLKEFTGACKLKQAVVSWMSDSLDESEVEQLQKSFAAIDADGNGEITFDELRAAFAKSEQLGDLKQIEAIFKAADIDGNGVLSYKEMMAVAVQRKLLAKEERLFNTFRALDLDGDGKVTREEIEHVLGKDSAEAIELIASADVDGDGTIDYDEFCRMWSDKQTS